MKNSTLKLIALCFALMTITACQDEEANFIINPPSQNIPDNFSDFFGDEISRDFLGSVVDINNNPIPNATVTIGNDTAMTDSNGVFIINNASVNERFGYIKVEKQGYIHGSRSVVPSNEIIQKSINFDNTQKMTKKLVQDCRILRYLYEQTQELDKRRKTTR